MSGLEDVIAVRTRLSRVDGQAGELVLAGHRVEDLARDQGFEAVCHLLWHGCLPEADALDELRAVLAERRVGTHERLLERGFVPLADPMDSLRSVLAGVETRNDLLEDALTLVATVPVANVWWWYARRSLEAPRPSLHLTMSADYLRMLRGLEAPSADVLAMDRYLLTVSDHGMNASTFAARVIASTRSDMVSAVVGAVGALKGPLHGGAPGPVLEMLDAIGEPERADDWLRAELAAGRRIMGMGHRVYRVRDPRAAVFEEAVTDLEAEGGGSARLRLARAVEAKAVDVLAERYPERSLQANVEFYTAVLLEALGLPGELFTPTFAVGRMAGWAAHVMEQRAEDRLIRPQSEYVGPEPQAVDVGAP
jgi:citrate synthase